MDEGVLTKRLIVIATPHPAAEVERRMRELVQAPRAFRSKPRFIGTENKGTWRFRQNLPRRGGFRPRIAARIVEGHFGAALEVTIRPPVVEFLLITAIFAGLWWLAFQTLRWPDVLVPLLFVALLFGGFWFSFAREAREAENAIRKAFDVVADSH